MKKALKGNLVFLWVFIALVAGIALIGGTGLEVAKCTIPVGLMATVVYFIPFNEKAKGIILASIPAIFAFILSAIQGGEIRMFYIYILSLVMQSLYLNRKLIIGYGSVMSLSLITIYFISPTLLVGSKTELIEFIIPMGAFIFTAIVLVLLTTLEEEKTLVADEQIDSSEEILEKLEVVLKEVSLSTNRLKEKFNSCDDKIKTGREGAQSIIGSMEALLMSAEAATTTVSNISRGASISRENVGQIYEVADCIDQYFKDAVDDVSSSQASVVSLRQEMDRMKEAISRKHGKVQQFSKQAEDIGGFVDAIAKISNQTNLLALDASIEAVRAGEDGEKFAGVAEKIRILSEESGELSNRIRYIIREPIQSTDIIIKNEDEIKSLNKKLEAIKNSFILAEEKIQEKLDVAKTIKNEFNIIDNDIHNITVVIEENAVRFEDILVKMGHQTDIINDASGLMGEIMSISDNLDKLVKFTKSEFYQGG